MKFAILFSFFFNSKRVERSEESAVKCMNRMSDLERYGQRWNLRLYGIPEGEDVHAEMISVCQEVLPSERGKLLDSVDVANRVGKPRQDDPRPRGPEGSFSGSSPDGIDMQYGKLPRKAFSFRARDCASLRTWQRRTEKTDRNCGLWLKKSTWGRENSLLCGRKRIHKRIRNPSIDISMCWVTIHCWGDYGFGLLLFLRFNLSSESTSGCIQPPV